MSPYLFAFYINDIEDVKNSGFGIYISSVFLGCILHADDILFLSGSCTGLQYMVNVCVQYRRQWDILFNPPKSQFITFGSSCCRTTFRITLDNVEVKKVGKLKYLGCYFYERTYEIDFSYGFRKFYGNFNNVMSVVGYYSNEIATLHLINSYCVP